MCSFCLSASEMGALLSSVLARPFPFSPPSLCSPQVLCRRYKYVLCLCYNEWHPREPKKISLCPLSPCTEIAAGKHTFQQQCFCGEVPGSFPPFFRRRHLLRPSGRYNLAYWFIYCFGCMATLFLWCLVNAAVAAPEKGSVVTSLSCVYSRTVFLGHKCAKYSLTRTFVAKGAKEESRIDKNLAWGCSIRNAPTAKSGRWKKERDRGERKKVSSRTLGHLFRPPFSFFFLR